MTAAANKNRNLRKSTKATPADVARVRSRLLGGGYFHEAFAWPHLEAAERWKQTGRPPAEDVLRKTAY